MASLQPSWLSSLNTISSTTKPTLFPSTNLNKPHPLKPFKLSFSLNPPNAESSQPNSPNSAETTPEAEPGPTDPVKLALENAKAYKKSVQMNKKLKIEKNPVKDGDGIAGNGESGPDGAGGGKKEVPAAVKIAMEKAKEYEKSKGIVGGDINAGESDQISGLEESTGGNLGNEIVDKKGKLSVSSIDFVGLGFADKKEGRGLPAGLVPIADYFPEGNSPDVEIIVGDARNFDAVARKPEQTEGDNSDVYKPKVSSWGVFPRPNDISKTFGGGRVIHPGEVLETAEEKAAKEARTRQLVAAYKSKMGMNIDPKLRSECEKALKDGDTLMDVGELKEALIYYEQVMDKLPFKSELHGLAALQWSICQDSLSRSQEAQVMYEKLQSHPTAKVSKKARQFVFSFQAMEMMKITRSSPWKNTGFQNYFEAFIENKSDYVLKEAEGEVGRLSQTLPYIIFLVSPIFIVLLIALQKRI
ncbi:PREDICTED: uncharacterized protein LOC103343400 isoform X1 [Prunus mume]|uniref:Uncharacterized protein LOC103343400 isoform X1 n=1 Tax=Prunus mume TaxID=102107 RepID=A0ABM0PVS6_PRUMU|nr:PREDICTED: uncharacterized protein LOC103343400 isoform X1 [Prunus mume]